MLDELAYDLHKTAQSKGFWPNPEYGVSIEFILSKLALVHSEVSEVLEAVRKQKGDQQVVEEMADIIIRLLDLYAGMKHNGWLDPDISLDLEIASKAAVNQQRPKMHGNLA